MSRAPGSEWRRRPKRPMRGAAGRLGEIGRTSKPLLQSIADAEDGGARASLQQSRAHLHSQLGSGVARSHSPARRATGGSTLYLSTAPSGGLLYCGETATKNSSSAGTYRSDFPPGADGTRAISL